MALAICPGNGNDGIFSQPALCHPHGSTFTNRDYMDRNRHNGLADILFFDGHVQRCRSRKSDPGGQDCITRTTVCGTSVRMTPLPHEVVAGTAGLREYARLGVRRLDVAFPFARNAKRCRATAVHRTCLLAVREKK